MSWLYFAFLFLCITFVSGNGGGIECAGCTIAVSIVEQLSLIHNKTVEETLDEICLLFPKEFESICTYFVNTYGADVIKLFDEEYNADEICQAIAFCTDPTCHLWPFTGKKIPSPIPKFEVLQKQRRQIKSTPWDWLIDLLKPLIDKSEPVLDLDGDLFSIEPTLRGSSWRGKDCDDLDSSIYPGRATSEYEPHIDYNCNGIYAIDNTDYETLYCNGTGQRGIIIVGDSAGAHFHIPPEYMNASAINEDTYDDLLFVISNEFDWPQLSSSTGYMNSTPGVPVNSFYKQLRERNLCNHRDYQNICRNGLRSGSSVDMAKTLSRNMQKDHPVLLSFELIGNDVCSGHHDFSHFTSIDEFRNNLLEIIGNFSQTLPMGSHVIFIGLAHGGILWDTMHARKHPIGATYAEVYELLNCLEISPCWTWMNSNETVRNIGNAWADKLSAVYDQVIATTKYPNFDMVYYPFPFDEIIKIWSSQGGETWQLIEPVDGFHPNQISNAILADWMFKDLLTNHPEFIGDINPHNADIRRLFGDQGGY